MKTVKITVYEAFDGTRFDTEGECRKYEDDSWTLRLVGLTIEQVNDALERSNIDLADAFERAGARIASLRREQGEFRRARNGEKAAPQISASPEDRRGPDDDAEAA